MKKNTACAQKKKNVKKEVEVIAWDLNGQDWIYLVGGYKLYWYQTPKNSVRKLKRADIGRPMTKVDFENSEAMEESKYITSQGLKDPQEVDFSAIPAIVREMHNWNTSCK